VVETEELAGAESKDHGLIVLLELVVDLGCHECCQLAVGERFVFVESLTIVRSAMLIVELS
jgi:hypothetical protein